MNKNLLKLAVVLLLVSLVFTGCKKDDESSSNSFSYNGKSYELTQGFLVNYGSVSKSTVYNFDLYLLTSGINVETGTGTGSYLYFEMFTDSSTGLGDGTYDYTDTYASLTFDYAKIYIDYNIETQSGSYAYIYDGTVTISKSGSTYTITIDCVDTNNKTIKGSYTGTLDMYSGAKSNIFKKR